MRLTTRARQAVIAMIDVALHQKMGPVALAGISRRRTMSVSYLEQMFTELRRSGLVESTRGQLKQDERWTLSPDGRILTIVNHFNSSQGPMVLTIVLDKE